MSNVKVSGLLLCTRKSSVENGKSIESKLLKEVSNKTVLQSTAEELLGSHFHEVIAVAGHDKDSLQRELKRLNIKMVFNKFDERGVHSFIKAGIMNLDPDCDFFATCFADQSGLKRKDYNQLINVAKTSNEALIICPTYQGKRGNPVLISAILVPEILDHEDTNQGYSYLFERHPNKIVSVEMDNDACLFDI